VTATCAACHRAIAGDADDVMVCVIDPTDGPLTFCTPCFWGEPRRLDWTQWRAPVPGEPYPMLGGVDP
jgi:hypothetical protein